MHFEDLSSRSEVSPAPLWMVGTIFSLDSPLIPGTATHPHLDQLPHGPKTRGGTRHSLLAIGLLKEAFSGCPLLSGHLPCF